MGCCQLTMSRVNVGQVVSNPQFVTDSTVLHATQGQEEVNHPNVCMS